MFGEHSSIETGAFAQLKSKNTMGFIFAEIFIVSHTCVVRSNPYGRLQMTPMPRTDFNSRAIYIYCRLVWTKYRLRNNNSIPILSAIISAWPMVWWPFNSISELFFCQSQITNRLGIADFAKMSWTEKWWRGGCEYSLRPHADINELTGYAILLLLQQILWVIRSNRLNHQPVNR